MLVDDERAIRVFLRRCLTQAGFGVLETANVADAISLLGAIGRDVDLLLTDYRLPGVNGGELVRCARDRWPTLPILCLTGYADELDVSVPLLEKPIDPEELVAAVQQMLRAT